MSYNLKYTIDYKRLSNRPTHIEILQNFYVGAVTALQADATPLTIQLQGNTDNIFCKTIGTGAIINVIATPLSLITLFNNSDPQAFIVKCYDSNTTNNLFWQGFVNPVYTEDYSVNFPTTVSINCSDGMQMLDTIYYKNSDGSFYTGNTTIATVINNVLSKLNLTVGNIYSDMDLRTNGYTTNIFTNIKVNQLNYINESFVPMSCREVLDSIFGGLDGMKVQFQGSDLYVVNPINLNDATKGRKYTLPGFSESTVNFGGYADIITGTTGGLTSIGYYQTGQNLGTVNQINEIDVKYNPYNITNFAYDFNANATGNTSFYHVTTPPNDYYRNITPVFPSWTQLTSGGTAASGHFFGIKETSGDTSIYGLLLDNSHDVLTYNIPFSNINSDTSLNFNLMLDSYCQTRLNSVDNASFGENIYGSSQTTPVYGYYVVCSIQCGDLYYNGYNIWDSSYHSLILGVIQNGVTYAQYGADHTKSIVNDTWATTARLIPISGGLTGGSITFSIYCIQGAGQITYNNSKPWYVIGAMFRRVLVKNLKIDVVDNKGVVITNNGVLTRGNISTNIIYKTNVTDIATTSGCGNYGVSKGSFFTLSNQTLINFGLYRPENSSARMTDKLLIQTFQSQYKVSRLKLIASLNVKNYGLSLQNKLIKNLKYINKAFYISSYSYVDDQESMDIEAVELVNTYDSI